MLISIVRTLILYVIIVIGFRLLGKRQLGELEPAELVVAILISELAAIPIQDIGAPILSGVFPIITLICLELIVSAAQIKSVSFRKLMCGKASIVIENGVISQRELRRSRLTTDELVEELRLKNVTDLSTVKYAIVETNGQLSVVLNADKQVATPKDLGLSPAESGLPVIIINDGHILDANMKVCGLDKDWLDRELSSSGISDPRDVFLLIVDELKKVYLLPREVGK